MSRLDQKYTDPFSTEEYARFVESMAQHCHCSPHHRPCVGVLAGGVCDGINDDREDTLSEREPDEERDEEDFRA